MRLRATLAALLALAGIGLAGSGYPRLVETWSDTAHDRPAFRRLLVLGLSADPELRWSFENGLVGQLKRRGIDAVTGYSLVPDLTRGSNRERILARLERDEFDGAISVRLVPLGDIREDQWIDAWRERRGAAPTFRGLVEETLPLRAEKAKRFGVEFDLWETTSRHRAWAARTDGHSRKQLRREAAALVQVVVDELRLSGRI